MLYCWDKVETFDQLETLAYLIIEHYMQNKILALALFILVVSILILQLNFHFDTYYTKLGAKLNIVAYLLLIASFYTVIVVSAYKLYKAVAPFLRKD